MSISFALNFLLRNSFVLHLLEHFKFLYFAILVDWEWVNKLYVLGNFKVGYLVFTEFKNWFIAKVFAVRFQFDPHAYFFSNSFVRITETINVQYLVMSAQKSLDFSLIRIILNKTVNANIARLFFKH